MDPNGRIYLGDDEKIPAEDKARLDGYLRGRAEADERELAREKLDLKEQMLAKLEAERGD